MRRLWILLWLVPGLAWAQQAQNPPPVQTYPSPTTTLNGNASGTIAATGTFQAVFARNLLRKGCVIQNNGTHSMYVSEGTTIGTASETTSYVLSPATSITCDWGGSIWTGEIDITGTASDAFYAVQF